MEEGEGEGEGFHPQLNWFIYISREKWEKICYIKAN